VIEYLDVIDATMTVIGVMVGFILGRRERNQRRPIAYPCDCGHAKSMHANGEDICHKGTCSCRTYIGPEPTVWTELES
jgi:hypothetical protein